MDFMNWSNKTGVTVEQLTNLFEMRKRQIAETTAISDQMRSVCCHTREDLLATVLYFADEYGWLDDPAFGVELTFSDDNSKIGEAISVNMPSGVTCRAGTACRAWCYALAGYYQFASVEKPRFSNLLLWLTNPKSYKEQLIKLVIRRKRDVRINDSGDMPDKDYFAMLCDVARLTNFVLAKMWGDHIRWMVFTKKYDLVNSYIQNGGKIPRGMRILFSRDPATQMNNPCGFHETDVFDPEQESVPEKAFVCPGKCDICRKKNTGCWNASAKYSTVVFEIHSSNAVNYKKLVAHRKEAA